MSGVRIREWRPMQKGHLVGFAKVELSSGLVLCDVTVLHGDRGHWASPPSKPMLDKSGVALKDPFGKTKYAAVVEFIDKETRDRFSAAVIDALRAAHPEAFN